MRKDLRPYWLKKRYLAFRGWYTDYFLRPECESLGPYDAVMKPWFVKISGPNIRIGKSFTAIGEPMHWVEIGVWGRSEGLGRIEIGNCVLMSPGSRLSASDEIILGDGVVLRCRLEEPGGGFLGILVGALAAQIHITKIGLGPGKALLG